MCVKCFCAYIYSFRFLRISILSLNSANFFLRYILHSYCIHIKYQIIIMKNNKHNLALKNLNLIHIWAFCEREILSSIFFSCHRFLTFHHEAPSELDSEERGTGPTMREGPIVPIRCRDERVIRQCQSDAAVDAKRSDDAIWIASQRIPKSRCGSVLCDPFFFLARN